jgi:hypothetical protein
MKRSLITLSVLSLLFAGCAANPQTRVEQTMPTPVLKAQGTVAPVLKVPDWFIQPPENTAQHIFVVGEATGPFLGMTVQKATLDADAKLAFQMKSQVEAMIKSFKTDTGGKYGAESAEMLTRKVASATIIGHHKVDSQITQEGSTFRVFVLMRYPLGEANQLLTAEQAARAQRNQAVNARRAEQEMKEQVERNRRAELDRESLDRGETIVQPQSKVEPVVVPESPKVQEKVSTTNGTELKLLDVDNEEYRQKRAEALAKPNAVVGQITLR